MNTEVSSFTSVSLFEHKSYDGVHSLGVLGFVRGYDHPCCVFTQLENRIHPGAGQLFLSCCYDSRDLLSINEWDYLIRT